MDVESIRSEIELRTSRSSGPGGQHAQKTETRVEAILDVEASEGLTAAEKRRVVAKAGPVLRAVAQDERSQLRNRELAVERLLEQLREAARVPRRRRPTAPTAAAREERLDEKRRRGQVKRLRRAPDPDYMLGRGRSRGSMSRESTPYRRDSASTATTEMRMTIAVMPTLCLGGTISTNPATIEDDYGI